MQNKLIHQIIWLFLTDGDARLNWSWWIMFGHPVVFFIEHKVFYHSSSKLINEWYPRGLQISLRIRSPGLQDYSEVWNLKIFWLGEGGILGHLGFGLYDNFHLGGILGHLRFGLSDNFHFGEVFWDTLDLDSMTIFIFGGYSGTPWIWTLWQFSFVGVEGILGHLRFGLSDNFHFGGWGYSGTPQIWTPWQFSFWGAGGYSRTPQIWTLKIFIWGVFCDTLDLDSLTIFILRGYSGTPQICTLWQFSFWVGILGHLGFGLSDNFHFWVGILGHLGFRLYDNFHFGWVFWGTSDLDPLTIFILEGVGGILEHLRFGLSDNFHLGGGYSGTPQIWTLWQFSFWGVGGILGHLRFGLSDNFHFGGGGGILGQLGFGLWQFSFWEQGDILGHLRFGLSDNIHFGGKGGILGHLRFGLWKFSFGGILGHLGFGLYDNFHFGGYSGTPQIFTLWQFSFWVGILGHLGFGLSDNFHFAGVFWDTSDLDSMTIFILGGREVFWDTSDLDSMTIFIFGGYSRTPQIWTLWQFSFLGGILGHLRFGLSDNFHFGWVFWDTSDLDSMTIFILGGYSGTPRIWTLWQFSFLGGYSGAPWIWTLWQFSFWVGILGHLRFGLYDNFHFWGVF